MITLKYNKINTFEKYFILLMKNYKHIFFDLDRTLWDFDENTKDTFSDLFNTYKLKEKGIPDVKIFFEKITDKIQLLPSQCIMIGNVYEKDIIGAKAVGMKTIFFNEKIITGNFPDADQIIFSMNELVAAINLIKNKT